MKCFRSAATPSNIQLKSERHGHLTCILKIPNTRDPPSSATEIFQHFLDWWCRRVSCCICASCGRHSQRRNVHPHPQHAASPSLGNASVELSKKTKGKKNQEQSRARHPPRQRVEKRVQDQPEHQREREPVELSVLHASRPLVSAQVAVDQRRLPSCAFQHVSSRLEIICCLHLDLIWAFFK